MLIDAILSIARIIANLKAETNASSAHAQTNRNFKFRANRLVHAHNRLGDTCGSPLKFAIERKRMRMNLDMRLTILNLILEAKIDTDKLISFCYQFEYVLNSFSST